MKLPVKEPSVVLEPVIVGFADVDQQTPLTLTAAPPLAEILPPETAVDAVIAETAVVDRVGIPRVVNEISFP